jgi:hypothetical protein
MDLPGNDGLFLAPSHYGSDISMQFSWEREDGRCEDGDIVKLFEKTPRDQVLKAIASCKAMAGMTLFSVCNY